MIRLVFVFAILIIAGCRHADKPAQVTIYDTMYETLNGRVKQLTEYHKTQLGEPETVSTLFNKNGIAISRTVINIDTIITNFTYKFNNKGKKTALSITRNGEKPILPATYKFDQNGRITEVIQPTKALEKNSDHILKKDRFLTLYDNAGNALQTDIYLYSEHKLQEKYVYNTRHLLMETNRFYLFPKSNQQFQDTSEKKQKPELKIIYQYKTFDSMGNWVKRIVTRHENSIIYVDPKQSETVETSIETRKITYY